MYYMASVVVHKDRAAPTVHIAILIHIYIIYIISYFEKKWKTGSILGAAEPFGSGAPLPNGYNAAPKCQRRCQMP